MPQKKKIILLTGPTASGKTALAVKLAKEFQGEIISADSRQVFLNMDLGSGKDLNEYEEIPYHLIDILPAGKDFSVSLFQQLALKAIEEIHSQNHLPILCGGSGHYIKALLQDYHFSHPATDLNLTNALESLSRTELLKRLSKFEEKQQKDWSQDSKRRLVRYLEKQEQSTVNKPAPEFSRDYEVAGFFLNPNREDLREKIELRLKQRLKEGMIEEVENLLSQGISAARLKRYGLEYKWITAYLLGELDQKTMQVKLATAIKQFAKRQMTFIRYMIKEGIELQEVQGFDELYSKTQKFLQT